MGNHLSRERVGIGLTIVAIAAAGLMALFPTALPQARPFFIALCVIGIIGGIVLAGWPRKSEAPRTDRTPDPVVYDALARYRDGFTASWQRGALVKQWAELATWRYACGQMFTTLAHTVRARLALHEWQRIEETFNRGDSWNDKHGALSALEGNRAALLATRDVLASLADKYAP
jgi:hypothetical protein